MGRAPARRLLSVAGGGLAALAALLLAARLAGFHPFGGGDPIASSSADGASGGAAGRTGLVLHDLDPASPAVLPGYAITVRGRLSDPTAGPVEVGGLVQPVDAKGRFAVTLGLRPGQKEVTVRAGSPPRAVEATIAVIIDEDPPVVTIDKPAEGFVSRTGAVDVEARVTDAHPGGEVALRIEGGAADGGGAAAAAPAPAIRLPLDGVLARTRAKLPPEDGSVVLVLETRDRAGHGGEARRPVAVDRTPPRIRIEAPREGDVCLSPTALDLVVEDAHPGAEVLVRAVGAKGTATEERRLPLADGRYEGAIDLPQTDERIGARIEVEATDRAGNVGRASVTVEVGPR